MKTATDETPFTGYITLYALTKGILESELVPCGNGAVRWYFQSNYGCYAHREGRDWHRTREGAAARAEEMRRKKIDSLRKSVAKLEKKKFV